MDERSTPAIEKATAMVIKPSLNSVGLHVYFGDSCCLWSEAYWGGGYADHDWDG